VAVLVVLVVLVVLCRSGTMFGFVSFLSGQYA
jgi:hypothetical protein